MQLECACILLVDGKERGSSRGLVCQSCQSGLPHVSQVSSVGTILHHFQNNPSPIEPQNLRRGLGEETLSNIETELLSCRKARLWIPIKSIRRINGLLILGVRRGGSRFTSSDLEILDVIGRQANIALDNIRLVAELNERDLERVRLHQQALRAGEKERKRLARELHDQIIQALVGFNFQLSELRRPLNPDLQTCFDQSQTEIRTIIGRLRQICADLRPPAMDSLGLVAVVRSQVRTMNETAPFRTTLEVEGDEKIELPEEVIMCVYRVLQEGLLNASKHSDARQVQVKLGISHNQVSLVVNDNGKGFVVPERLGQFTVDDHFGLLGMYERVELVNGKMDIQSCPGQGCQMIVEIPLSNKETASLVTI
jgi:signal transduction histidine kinase